MIEFYLPLWIGAPFKLVRDLVRLVSVGHRKASRERQFFGGLVKICVWVEAAEKPSGFVRWK